MTALAPPVVAAMPMRSLGPGQRYNRLEIGRQLAVVFLRRDGDQLKVEPPIGKKRNIRDVIVAIGPHKDTRAIVSTRLGLQLRKGHPDFRFDGRGGSRKDSADGRSAAFQFQFSPHGKGFLRGVALVCRQPSDENLAGLW